MTISRPLWVSQRGGGAGGAGEVVIAEDTTIQIPSITATLGYVGANDDPVVTLDITDPATDAEELRVYRSTSTIDATALPAPLETLTPATVSDDDAAVSIGTTYHYRLGSVTGGLVRLSAEVSVAVVENTGPDYSSAQVGDAIGGGIYGGTISIGGTDYHLIFGLQSSEASSLTWKDINTDTVGSRSDYDGLANTQDLEAAGISNFPAAEHCVNYSDGVHLDWYLPARHELALVDQLVGMSHPEFTTDLTTYRWTSTKSSATATYYRRFSDGLDSSLTQTSERRVRPVRRVAV